KHGCSFGFSHVRLLVIDDGEIYDEFGNLKNEFRSKTQQAQSGQMVPGSERAGWVVDEIDMVWIKAETATEIAMSEKAARTKK
ncbi:unnamed protein product, partial [Musa textilis]